jgi:L-ascorbate metabolism protein UlaG (beta-lactamase superfamily)
VHSLPRLTYLGGPTALLEWRGLRLLTDPTFDPAGTTYELPAYTLRKTQAPAITTGELGRIDAVLLSHDHHFDNLDHAGRSLLGSAERVLTTVEGAARGAARVAAAGNRPLTVTAAEAVQVARSMSDALIVPLHFEGWEHFIESLADVEAAFAAAGLTSRLLVPRPGVAIELRLP